MTRTLMGLRIRAGLLFLMASAICVGASAQMTSVTAPSGSLTMNGSPIANGTASLSIVDALRGGAVAVRAGDKIFAPQAISCAITAGAISGCSVPDLSVALSLRPNVTLAYNILVYDAASHGSYVLQNVGGVQGTTWALNTYAPAQNAPVVATALSSGSSVPSSCRGAAKFYTQTTPPADYDCVGNVFVLQTSSGGSSVSVTWRNAYGSGTTYAVNDAVSYNGSSYISLQASNTGHQPDTSSSWWGLLAAKGTDGTAGTNGTNGTNGADATLGSYAFASFPTTGLTANKTMVIQTDAAVGSSCTAGGGAVRRLCLYNGTAWVPADNFAAEKGVANGIASLDGTGHVPSAQQAVATNSSPGAVQLPAGQASSTLAPVAITGNLTDLNGAASVLAVAQVGGVWCNWDSYGYGLGPLNPAKNGICQLFSADVPAPLNQISANGATLGGIASFDYTAYQSNGFVPDVALVGAGENDGSPTCSSATAACGYAWKEMKLAHILHYLVPLTYSNSILASNATKSGAAVTNDTTIYGTFNKTALGYPVTSNGTSTLTFNIPSSSATKVQIHYVARTANTGSFVAAIDSSSVMDEASGTTTFSGAPLFGWTLAPATYAMYVQEFTVTPNQAHTVVITTTGIAEISRVTWNAPAASAPKNIVYDFNVVQIWPNYAVQNTIDAAVDAQLKAEGFNVGSVDIQNGTPTSSTYWSSLNPVAYPQAGVPYSAAQYATTATTTCTASQASQHPNECGTQDWYRNLLNAEANMGIIVSRVALGGKSTEQTGVLYSYPKAKSPKFNPTLLDSTYQGAGSNGYGYATYIGGNAFAGVIGWTDTSTGKPWSGKIMTGPVADSNFNTNLWYCRAHIASYTDTQVFANSNQVVDWCDDPAGNSYRNFLVQNIGTAIASGVTIPVSTPVVHVTGTNAISGVTPTATVCTTSGLSCTITLIPDAIFTLATGGTPSTTTFTFNNATTAVVGRPVVLTCDPAQQRCYASY